MPSWLLVALQLTLMGVLLVTALPPANHASPIVAGLLFVAGTIVGLAALTQNRLGNFRIGPEPKAGAQLATQGIYRWIRHPMYCAVLLVTAGALALDPQLWRALLWLALLAVLIAKLRREELYLRQCFAQYAAYCERTWRLLPGLW
jgi:protein-S-isoprenylcysteine O-methyltransferase Ste14